MIDVIAILQLMLMFNVCVISAHAYIFVFESLPHVRRVFCLCSARVASIRQFHDSDPQSPAVYASGAVL